MPYHPRTRRGNHSGRDKEIMVRNGTGKLESHRPSYLKPVIVIILKCSAISCSHLSYSSIRNANNGGQVNGLLATLATRSTFDNI